MPIPVAVRRFSPKDLPGVMEIETASFGKDAYDGNLFAEFFHKCGELFLIAEINHSICGYIIACKRGDPSRAEVISVAVAFSARGRGVASALMDSTLRRLRPRGITRLSLMVRIGNEPALAFYRKYGFRRLRVVRRYYEDGTDGILMARTI